MRKMKASTKTMSSAKANTRHAIRAIMGDVNSEKEMVGLVSSAIGSHVEQFNNNINYLFQILFEQY